MNQRQIERLCESFEKLFKRPLTSEERALLALGSSFLSRDEVERLDDWTSLSAGNAAEKKAA